MVEDTPQQIREKVQKISSKAQKQGAKEKPRDATVVVKKSKPQSMHVGARRGVSESERESMSKYSMKSIQPLDSARGGGNPDEQASSFDESPSCPRIYEEIIQGLEADIRKHIRIEHQLKLHIESVEDRVEELERDLEKYENKSKKPSTSKEDETGSNHSKKGSQVSDTLNAAKYMAELLELKAQIQNQKTHINKLKESIKAKDEKEVDLQKEIGQQTQALVLVKEELLSKNEKVLQMETQIEELASIR